MRSKKLLVIAATLGVGMSGVIVQARATSPYNWAAGLAGCHTSHPAVAHHANKVVLDPQPTDGPVPCGTLTGYPTVETRIEVTNDNQEVYEPALSGGPVLAGSGNLPGGNRNGLTVAVTSNNGSTWHPVTVHVFPGDQVGAQVDNNLYVDHDTGRTFWYMYSSSGTPGTAGGCGAVIGGGTVAFSDDTTNWGWGFDRDHDCSENPTVLTAKFRLAAEQIPPAYPNVVYLCGDNTSTGAAGTGNLGFSCSKSLTGGARWLGTTLDTLPTLNPQGFYSGPVKDQTSPYKQCAGGSSSAGADVQPLPDGTLMVLVSCGSNTFLSESADEGATWNIVQKLPHGGALRSDSLGNTYLLEKTTTSDGGPALLLSHSTDGGATWSPELNMVAPGVASVGTYNFAQGTYAPGQVGHVAVTYYGVRAGKADSDGFISETREALAANPVFWSGQVNDPSRPLLYDTTGAVGPVGTTPSNIGITVLDFIGGALSPDGRSAWGSWVQDCGTNMITDPNCQSRWGTINPINPQDGFAGRLVWPSKDA